MSPSGRRACFAHMRVPGIGVRSAAVLSDVHGNVVALKAVLKEVFGVAPDLVVFGGDLTWGPLPEETVAVLESLTIPALYIRGNAERSIAEISDRLNAGSSEGLTTRERWMVERHSSRAKEFLAGFAESAVVEVGGLGAVRFCHGSPRSDEELVTFATPEPRMQALLEGVAEKVLVTAHTHIQFDREVAGIRSVNPGSVGMPYQGRAGAAYWALLGSDVELRCTEYDVEHAIRSYRSTDDPMAEEMVEILVSPPTPEEVVQHAEAAEFSG